ncbi:MAG: hypothetical protein IPP29_01810 [Bacteroidetes bacterium]|nr:hypothetical protein [Bacteroidota bacterium]
MQKPKRNFSITNNTIINPRIGIAVLNHNYIHIGFDPVNNITSANTIQYNLTTALLITLRSTVAKLW